MLKIAIFSILVVLAHAQLVPHQINRPVHQNPVWPQQRPQNPIHIPIWQIQRPQQPIQIIPDRPAQRPIQIPGRPLPPQPIAGDWRAGRRDTRCDIEYGPNDIPKFLITNSCSQFEKCNGGYACKINNTLN